MIDQLRRVSESKQKVFRSLADGCLAALSFMLLCGCANVGVIQNQPILTTQDDDAYSLLGAMQLDRPNDVDLLLSFSGGGTRAAALAYGVLMALRETQVRAGEASISLLDEVDVITSVSGGSFTAAYYGLHDDEIFSSYEDVFLRANIERRLKRLAMNPLLLFSRKSRTEAAIEYFDEVMFHNAVFRDMRANDGPLIVINSTDLSKGVRFSFIQEYFSMLCSDLASFPIARAVVASSAVPVVFEPVVLENHSGCDSSGFEHFEFRDEGPTDSPLMDSVMDGLATFSDKDERRYIHLVDGGISDNLGLLATYEMVEAVGGIRPFAELYDVPVIPKFIVISVDAAASPDFGMDKTRQAPSLLATIQSMAGVQLRRTNATTLELFAESMQSWSAAISTDKLAVEPYFVQLSFENVENAEKRERLQQIPTGFHLTDDQVSELITVGKELLFEHPEFQRFLSDTHAPTEINLDENSRE